MKTYKNLYTNILDIGLIEKCIMTASKGKRKKPPVKRVIENKEWYASQLLKVLSKEDYYFQAYKTVLINEGSMKKERTVVTPLFFPDQIIHHLIVSQLKPIVLKSLYEHSYGSIPDRGVHIAKKQLEKWIKKMGNKRFYVFKCDIRHFYDSVDHSILKNKLQRKITDNRFIKLLFSLIDSFEEEPGKGIPKGFYTSQWLANFYLSEMDHFIKEQLHVKYYIRYMDDIVLLGTNKRKLRNQAQELEKFLNNNLDLKLKDNKQLYRFVDKDNKNGRDIDFMGFRFFRNKTILRKSNLRTIRRKAYHLEKKRKGYQEGTSQGVNVHDAQSMLSYLGWTKHADVYNWYQKEIKPRVNKRRLRKKVSHSDLRKNKLEKQKELNKD